MNDADMGERFEGSDDDMALDHNVVDNDGRSQGGMDKMIMSLSASHEVTDEVTKRINKTWHDIEKDKEKQEMDRRC